MGRISERPAKRFRSRSVDVQLPTEIQSSPCAVRGAAYRCRTAFSVQQLYVCINVAKSMHPGAAYSWN